MYIKIFKIIMIQKTENLLLLCFVSFWFLLCLNIEWTGRMNHICACVRGIVEGKVIFA